MTITDYLLAVANAHRLGNATEHTYRADFQTFLEGRLPGAIKATNEPKRIKCGAPDYIITRMKDSLTLGYVEAKDLGADLAATEKTPQLQRYLKYLPNLLLTDYLSVRWYVSEEGGKGWKLRGAFALGTLGAGGKIVADAGEQEKALSLIDSFLGHTPVRITTAPDLALRMARLTHMVRDTIVEAFKVNEATQQLRDWREAFAKTLLPELQQYHLDAEKEAKARDEFADMFAQTLAYGLFSAQVSSPGGEFTRAKAQKLIPRTNPFLRVFFEQITGSALDDEPFAGFVDDLVQTLNHSDMRAILENFGQRGRRTDPVVHFYEDFLKAYDPKLREMRGVYYTPEPVVNYIVESVDHILVKKFGIKDGLADATKIPISPGRAGVSPAVSGILPGTSGSANVPQDAKHVGRDAQPTPEETHRVLILDPAAGTATFLYRVLDFIREQFERKKNLGVWGDYVHQHLLPRLFGFELLMAPYAVAHFKIGLALGAWDKEPLFRPTLSYEPHSGERINIFLTNTLEDLQEKTEQLGPLRMLSDEANAAYEIKRNKPVLVILGNPPYSGHSANKGKWIGGLVRDYYFCDGKPLGERNPKWLQDDYVKFIRWAQWRIEQTGSGVLAFITNHGYLDNPTFRGMRQSLMATFDEIYLVDLHGNSKKKEIDPETGKPDKNVFDIQQGVAIGIFVKLPPGGKKGRAGVAPAVPGVSPGTSDLPEDVPQDAKQGARDARPTPSPSIAAVFHAHRHGSQRKVKYEWLNSHNLTNTNWTKLEPVSPNYYFIPQDKVIFEEYRHGWKITEAMPINGWGIATRKDYLLVNFEKQALGAKFERILALPPLEAIAKFGIKTAPHWNFVDARLKLPDHPWKSIYPILFRPFDSRYVFYEKAMIERGDHRMNLMRHMFHENVALITVRRIEDNSTAHFFSTNQLSVLHSTSAKEGNFVFPLYIYPEGKPPNDDLFVREELEEEPRQPNFSPVFIEDFCAKLNVKFSRDGLGRPDKREIGPELIFHYAYAVFHSPGYRQRYAEFLRADFPRLPITSNYQLFQELAGLGGQLVDFHARGQGDGSATTFPVKGSNVIEEVRYLPPYQDGPDPHLGRVWINKAQYFDGVSPAAWHFPVGGYQPAKRWLNDRAGRALAYDDLSAYPRIIAALGETGRLMAEIEASIEAHGGWPGAFAGSKRE